MMTPTKMVEETVVVAAVVVAATIRTIEQKWIKRNPIIPASFFQNSLSTVIKFFQTRNRNAEIVCLQIYEIYFHIIAFSA